MEGRLCVRPRDWFKWNSRRALVVGFKPLLYYVLSGTPAWLALADALRI
jgi:hypothetical protein